MIRSYAGKTFVPGGTYLNSSEWELVAVPPEGDYLAGDTNVTYYRVPLLMVLALGPLMGLGFILFLPVAVPIVIVYAVGRLAVRNLPWRRRMPLRERRTLAR